MCLYFPIGIVFGIPNAGQVVSALNTDPAEAFEFLGSVLGWSCLFSITAPLAFACSYTLSRKKRLLWWNNHWLLLFLAVWVCGQAGNFEGVHQGYRQLRSALGGLRTLELSKSVKPSWEVINCHPEKQVYVLVIGESARRDYMHAYGYPIENTPFMESKGIIIDGAFSADDYTVPSIQKMFTLPTEDKSKDPLELNILDAANLSGFETFWLSNQGKINKKDTPITVIATRAKHSLWTKEHVDRDEKIPDSSLLPLLRDAVSASDPSNKPKLIILHLMGSHASVCERLHNQPLLGEVKDSYYRDPLCYVSSIKQTDSFLSEVNRILKDSGKSFSVIYLADHGVSHNVIKGKIVMNHAQPASAHRQIPLYQFDENEAPAKKIQATKFLSNMTEGVLHWLGIKTKQLPHPQDLFSPSSQDDVRNEIRSISTRRKDDAIDIRGK